MSRGRRNAEDFNDHPPAPAAAQQRADRAGAGPARQRRPLQSTPGSAQPDLQLKASRRDATHQTAPSWRADYNAMWSMLTGEPDHAQSADLARATPQATTSDSPRPPETSTPMSINDDDRGGGYKRRPTDARDDRSRGDADSQGPHPDALSPLNWLNPPREQRADARDQYPALSPLRWLDSLGSTTTSKGADADSSGAVVQAKGELAGPEIQGSAARGVASANSPLPHLDTIQQSFGRHDVSHVRAQLGGAGTDAAESIGAEAYATGNRIAFADPSPSLHTAAHEAAHVVQQRSGVSLKGGVGQAGDPYEQHADAVADAVVRGESAEHLLGAGGAPGTPSTAVQRRAKKRKSSGKVYVEIGGEKLAIEGDSLIRHEDVLGTITGGRALAKGLRSKAPDQIDFTPAEGVTSPPAGDLLAGAADGTRVTSGDTVWVWSEGGWNSLAGRKGRGGGEFGGYKKTGGGSVAAALTKLVATGAIALPPEQIAVIDAVSKVETGGDIGAVNTYDDQVMSIGFKQVVLGHGSLEKLMVSAPAGFAKHGLTVDTSKRYPKRKEWSHSPHQIVGAPDAEDLRSPEWAAKFYAASMEPDVVAAMCKLMLAEMAEVSATTASKGGANTNWLDDPTAHAWLLEVNNNRPAYMTIVVTQVANAPATDRDAFLDALAAAIIATYVEQEPLLHYKRAKRGKVLTPDQDAALLDKMKLKYEAKGRHKGENIVTKIPRQLGGAPGESSPAAATNRGAASTPALGSAATTTAAATPQRTPSASTRASWTDQAWGAGQSGHPTPSGPTPSAGSRTPVAQPKAADSQDDDAPWFFGGDDVESDHPDPWAMPAQSSPTRGTGPAKAADVSQTAAQIGGTLLDAISGLATPLLGDDQGGKQKKPTTSPSAPVAPVAPRSHAPVGPGDVRAFDGKELGELVAQLGSPEASAIAADLAGLVALSDTLRRKASEREEHGADRDRLVAAIGALKARLAALPAGRNADAADRFKASVNRTLQEISPFYFQSRNVDILEVPEVTKTRTCNVTVLGMALESLGKDASMYRGRWDGVEAAAGVYKHKLDGSDPKSRGAVDATQGQGASRTNLIGMRLPDFLELAAIALAMPNGTDESAVKAGAKEAWDGILAWGNLQTLATQFGVSASIEYLDVSGTAKSRKKHTDSKALRAHGKKHRPDVEKYLNAHIAAEESGSKKSKDKEDALRPAYEAAVSNDDLDATVSIDAYREYVQKKVGAELDSGAAVIVGLANHFVKLQAIADDHIVVNDPARASRQGTVLSYEEARAMGYFHMRFVLR